MALISLLYKKGLREIIKNWRPVSLSNNDTKILSKLLAERLKIALPEIIHTDQKGCLKGRYIGQGIRLMEDIIEKCEEDEVILLIDQEKAFDRVEWEWLNNVMNKFNCGERFITWINILYKHMKSAIVTNGHVSRYFPITRGIRQGDSLSALLYILQSEPLHEYFRKREDIKGITIQDTRGKEVELKGSQYVDDQNLFLKHTNDINKCMGVFEDFGDASGSKVNRNKTIGLIPKEKNIKLDLEIVLTTKPEMALGVPISKSNIQHEYWEGIIEKLIKRVAPWKIRKLSLTGKVYIIKSLGLSQMLYGCEMITISDGYIKTVMDILWDFLWEGKKCFVSRKICQLPRNMGGLNFPNLEDIVKVKRVKMLINILKGDINETWCIMPLTYFKCLDTMYNVEYFALKVDDSEIDIKQTKIPVFYQECILAFQELCRKGKSYDQNEDEIIWCNSKLKINGMSFRLKHWSKSGIQHISDIVKGNTFLDSEIKKKHKTHKANFEFEMYSIKKSWPNKWMTEKLNLQCKYDSLDAILKMQFEIPSVGIKMLKDMSSSELYSIFMYSENVEMKSKDYWSNKFSNIIVDFESWFTFILNSKIIPRKCLDFNWRIFHGQINTENRLKHMKFSNGMCCLCQLKNENIEHLLTDCIDVQTVWTNLENIIDYIFNMNKTLHKFDKIVGLLGEVQCEKDEVINMMLSIARWLIWKRRCLFKFDDNYINQPTLLIWIKNEIKEHVKILLKSEYVKKNSTLSKYLLLVKDKLFH